MEHHSFDSIPLKIKYLINYQVNINILISRYKNSKIYNNFFILKWWSERDTVYRSFIYKEIFLSHGNYVGYLLYEVVKYYTKVLLMMFPIIREKVPLPSFIKGKQGTIASAVFKMGQK